MSSYRAKNFFVEPLTDTQGKYLDALSTHDAVFGVGCAGTGKTFLALSVALSRLMSKDIRRVIITRPTVSADEVSLGFFKGTKEEKLAEWMGPILSTIAKTIGPDKMAELIQSQKIIFEALETMRGSTFDNSMVILDEAQNTTRNTLKMFLTRIGEHSSVAINGDTDQTDLGGKSGLADVVRMVSNNPYQHVPVIEFSSEDVVRSQICKNFILMFRDWERPVLH